LTTRFRTCFSLFESNDFYVRDILTLTRNSEQTVLSGVVVISRLLTTFLVFSSLMTLFPLMFVSLVLFGHLHSSLLMLHMMLMA
jgi:hypothetical protein